MNSHRRRNTLGFFAAAALALGMTACNAPQTALPHGAALGEPASGGNYLEAEAQADLQALATVEPARPTTGAAKIKDANASGGQAVILYTTGAYARFTVPSGLTAGNYTVRVRARGVYYQAWPIVALKRNGNQLASSTVASSTYVTNTFGDYALAPGDKLDVTFTNDLNGGTSGDRNVVVDYLVLDPVAAPAPDPGPSPTPTPSILTLINNARAQGRYCGTAWYPAAPALAWNSQLEAAALAHSQDMASKDYFSHTGSDGSSPGTRITQAGYSWWTYGENIAAGYATEAAVMDAWIASAGHCANIMTASFKDVGVASATGGTYGIYWTMDLASSN